MGVVWGALQIVTLAVAASDPMWCSVMIASICVWLAVVALVLCRAPRVYSIRDLDLASRRSIFLARMPAMVVQTLSVVPATAGGIAQHLPVEYRAWTYAIPFVLLVGEVAVWGVLRRDHLPDTS